MHIARGRVTLEPAATVLRQSYSWSSNLSISRLPAQLPTQFRSLRKPRRPDRVTPGTEPAAGVDRPLATDTGCSARKKLVRFAVLAEAKLLVVKELPGRHRVM